MFLIQDLKPLISLEALSDQTVSLLSGISAVVAIVMTYACKILSGNTFTVICHTSYN